MKSDLLLAVTQLAAERNLPSDVVISAVQAALVSAYKRDAATGGHDVAVELDAETGDVTVRMFRTVVDEVTEPLLQVSLEEARKRDPTLQVGDQITVGYVQHNPGRIAAQTAKQVVMQRLREAERDLVFDEYADRAGDVITATVQRIDPRQITVDLGRAEAIMPPSEQVPYERYRPGQQLKFYVVHVGRTPRGPEIIVSRTHTELLRRLFEMEVPEIYNGVVEIKAIAREPGSRSKVAVFSNQSGVDAVGACVGLRGLRIQNVVNELLGEKIDVIEWDAEPPRFIANSLSPATVQHVRLDDETGSAHVTVPDRQLSLAIGREGQNARLAAKLTNWRIDIRSASALAPVVEEAAPAPAVPAAVTEVEAPPVEAAAVEAVEEAEELVAAEAGPPAPAGETRPAAEAPEAVEAAEEAAVVEELETARAEGEPEAAPAAIDDEETAALRALEEELARLEREEAERERREAEAAEAAAIEISSDELWQVAIRPAPEEAGALRFAEDIEGFREYGTGRRARGRRPDRMSAKARRAAAKKGRSDSSSG
ncbi:MAG: transcription termination/antitermination protein NusA [Gemmatimonadetes bacterium]|nr:transcription termination/antitermination protein NusA [Gemmatimonadota bacterium]